jgi:hypothetical protein
MNVPFSRVDSGSPEHPATTTNAIATSRPLIMGASFVRTSFLLASLSSFHAAEGHGFSQPIGDAVIQRC